MHGTLPGERVIVQVVKSKKNHAEADLIRILEASPRRLAPKCPVFGECGGCAYQHMDYALQLETKTTQVADLLRRVGGITTTEVLPMLASPLIWEYRNRLSVHVNRGQIGFYHRKSHHLIDVAACPLGSESVNAELSTLRESRPRYDSRITLRENTGLKGFSQVNDGAAELLAGIAREMAPSGDLLVDAYCGSGFFSKKLRSGFQKIIGIEWSDAAVRAAKMDATEKETYISGSVENHLRDSLPATREAGVTLLVDPPAEGLSPDVIHAILTRPPETLVYISCDPATFARDAKKLLPTYVLERVQPVDMFPQTAEIELIARFRRA